MKKIVLISLFSLVFHLGLFAQDSIRDRLSNAVWPVNNAEYLVVSENVRIRDAPNVSSKVLGSVSFPAIVVVDKIEGSNEMVNGVVDRWAHVCGTVGTAGGHMIGFADSDYWINSYYIAAFPVVISARTNYKTWAISEDDTVFITGYYANDGKLYFGIEELLNSYYHDDISYNISARPVIQGISVIDNSWTRLYNFCDNFENRLHELSGEWLRSTENPAYKFDYGICVGMDAETLKDTLGNLFGTEDTTWNGNDAVTYIYEAMYIGVGHTIEFTIYNDKVAKINYVLAK